MSFPIRSLGAWPRRVIAVLCLVLAAISLRGPGRHAAVSTVKVVVTIRAVPAGAIFTRADLSLAQWPRSLTPSAATDLAAIIGRRAAGPLVAGEVITPTRLVSTALTTGLSGGLVAVSVALSSGGTAGLVQAGDFIDLIAAREGGPPSVLVRQVRVLAVLPGTMTTAGRDADSAVVAVDETGELALAAVTGNALFASVRPPP